MSDKSSEIPIVCVLDALTDMQHQRLADLHRSVFGSVQAKHELEHGYRFVLPVEAFDDVAALIALERLCCPFFDFKLHLAAGRDSLDFEMTGGDGVKGFMRAELGL